MCSLCRAEAATDPWMTCPVCVVLLPVRMRPPTLSRTGVAACLELRARMLAGDAPVEVPVSLVAVDGDRWSSGSRWRPKRDRGRRAA